MTGSLRVWLWTGVLNKLSLTHDQRIEPVTP